MGEIVNVLVAFAVIVFLFRWLTSGNTPREQSRQRSAVEVLGFRPKNVTQEMISTISNMFPDIPIDNIKFDLLRSGSVEVTTNKILERGYLDAPPAAYYTLHPRTNTPMPGPAGANTNQGQHHTSNKQHVKENLISKFSLEQRIANGEDSVKLDDDVGGKAVWEDSAEKREASLKERKARMILAARQRLLSQQQNDGSSKTDSGISSSVQS